MLTYFAFSDFTVVSLQPKMNALTPHSPNTLVFKKINFMKEL